MLQTHALQTLSASQHTSCCRTTSVTSYNTHTTLSLSLTHTHTHHSLSLSLSHTPLSLTHTHTTLSLSLSLTHTHTSLSLSHTHTHLSLSLSHTHTHTHLSLSLTHTHTHTPLSLSHTHTHTHTSLSHTHTHTSLSLSLTHTKHFFYRPTQNLHLNPALTGHFLHFYFLKKTHSVRFKLLYPWGPQFRSVLNFQILVYHTAAVRLIFCVCVSVSVCVCVFRWCWFNVHSYSWKIQHKYGRAHIHESEAERHQRESPVNHSCLMMKIVKLGCSNILVSKVQTMITINTEIIIINTLKSRRHYISHKHTGELRISDILGIHWQIRLSSTPLC